jgi:hypothetical protein
MNDAQSHMPETEPLRILAVSALWQGANDYAFVRAFRRMGHSVRVVSEKEYLPAWQNRLLRLVRRVMNDRIVEEYNRALLHEARMLQPDLLFVFKGALVKGGTLRAIREAGTICIQFYPDVSFRTHGLHLPGALPEYDWIFSTKSFGLKDMADQLSVTNSSFLPHAFDPETHVPVACPAMDAGRYACDLSFVGNHSPKKQKILEGLKRAMPDLDLKLWGPAGWSVMPDLYQGHPVLGIEYAKAIRLSRINLGLLSEQREGASSGDLITARTFEICGAGGFMMHERTAEAEQFFEDGKECVMFSDHDEMVDRIRHYLAHDEERRAIAWAGRQRSLDSGYSTDDRARAVIAKYQELRALSGSAATWR